MTAPVWATLNDRNRRDLLELLRQRPRAVNELVDELRLSQPAVSKHLRVLRDAGLVRVTVQAQRRIYTVDTGPLIELDHWLAPYRALWNASLDTLGRHLDASDQANPPAKTNRPAKPNPPAKTNQPAKTNRPNRTDAGMQEGKEH